MMRSRIKENIPLIILILVGLATGIGMISLGLTARISGVFPENDLASWFGASQIQSWGLDDTVLAYALVLAGCFWISAVLALGVRNRWGWWSVLLIAMGSMLFFPGGAVTGIIVGSILLLTGMREQHGLLFQSTAK